MLSWIALGGAGRRTKQGETSQERDEEGARGAELEALWQACGGAESAAGKPPCTYLLNVCKIKLIRAWLPGLCEWLTGDTW